LPNREALLGLLLLAAVVFLMGDENQGKGQHDLYELITNVRLEIKELSVKVDQIKDLNVKVGEVEKLGHETSGQAKSAHERLDALEDNLKWIWRTIGGAIVAAVAAYYFRK